MTWTWSIPLELKPVRLLQPPLIRPSFLRAVVPTYRDWDAARTTIESLLACRPRPAEIVLVNDNAEFDPPAWTRRLPITLLNYEGNRGPSYARNAGASHSSGRRIDWLYFTDTGCERESTFFEELIEASMSMPRATVAIAAPVVGVVESTSHISINRYMTEEAILSPPKDQDGPQAIITANAAVSASAFGVLGGFDTTFPFAAGEDLDLGIRLRSFGTIGWAERAIVRHRFGESLDDFKSRFVRYGAGNAHLVRKFRMPSLRVDAIHAKDPKMQALAELQVHAMQVGYDRHDTRSHAEIVRIPGCKLKRAQPFILR